MTRRRLTLRACARTLQWRPQSNVRRRVLKVVLPSLFPPCGGSTTSPPCLPPLQPSDSHLLEIISCSDFQTSVIRASRALLDHLGSLRSLHLFTRHVHCFFTATLTATQIKPKAPRATYSGSWVVSARHVLSRTINTPTHALAISILSYLN